jgi:organic radical activating enzyme
MPCVRAGFGDVMEQHTLLPILRTLSVMLTHKCNAECADCGTLSGPKVGGRADIASVTAAIEGGPANGFVNVVFTGGEPTIYFEDLLVCIAHARAHHLTTRVVTNGGWCRTAARTAGKLDRLIEAGLDEINFSTGDEHVRFVPLDLVVNGIVAALDRKLPVHLMIEKRRERGVTRDTVLAHPMLAAREDRDMLGISESPWMPLNPYVTQAYDAGTTANRENISSFGGCDSVLQTYVLHPANEVTSCCGIGARMIPELRAESDFSKADRDSMGGIIAEAEEDFLKLWLRQEGPEKILQWASGHDESIEWENLYAHRCQACARLYRDPKVRGVLAQHYAEKIPDVLARSLLFEVQTTGGRR